MKYSASESVILVARLFEWTEHDEDEYRVSMILIVFVTYCSLGNHVRSVITSPAYELVGPLDGLFG